jgi:hypothetical protein
MKLRKNVATENTDSLFSFLCFCVFCGNKMLNKELNVSPMNRSAPKMLNRIHTVQESRRFDFLR